MPKFLESEEDQTDEKVSFSRRVNPKSKSTFMHCNTENSLCQALARERVRVNRRGSGKKRERKRYSLIDSDSLKARHLVITTFAHAETFDRCITCGSLLLLSSPDRLRACNRV